MELVGDVVHALAAAPADRRALPGAERLGHEHVVVDRHGVQPGASQQAREGVRAEDDLACPHLSVRRRGPQPPARTP